VTSVADVPQPLADPGESGYRSAFRSWDTRAWIRAKPHRTAAFTRGLTFFTPDVVPIFTAPTARTPDETVVDELCVRHLQWHLAMTVGLELGPVNDAVAVIRDPDRAAWFARELRHDALRLYADEAGHAEMANGMADAVERATGIAAPTAPAPFARLVADAVAAAPEPVRDVVRLLAAFVSETLITTTLTLVPYDDRVQTAVRQLLADHADDERRHAVFFRDVFAATWPRLDPETRRVTGTLVPGLVHAFLAPDRDELAAAARAHPDVFGDADEAALSAGRAVAAAVPAAAGKTVAVLARYGAFDDPVIAAAFAERGLLPDDLSPRRAPRRGREAARAGTTAV
jgi:hypothetical protein